MRTARRIVQVGVHAERGTPLSVHGASGRWGTQLLAAGPRGLAQSDVGGGNGRGHGCAQHHCQGERQSSDAQTALSSVLLHRARIELGPEPRDRDLGRGP